MLSVPKATEDLTLEEVKSQIYSRNNPTLTPIEIVLDFEAPSVIELS